MPTHLNELLDNVLGNDIPTNIFTVTDDDPNVILGKLNEIIHWLENATPDDFHALPDTTKYGADISLTMNDTTFIITAQLKDQDGNNLGTAKTIDLPLEATVVSGSYDSDNKTLVLTLKSGSDIEIPLGDLIGGLQSEITSDNKLSADLVDDTSTTNKFVTSADKANWNGKADIKQTYARVYKSIPDISNTLTTSSTMLEVMTAMVNNSKLIADIASYINLYPDSNYTAGLLEIEKVNVNRATARYTAKANASSTDCLMWYGEFQNAQSGYEWSGWHQVLNASLNQTVGGTKTFSNNIVLNNNKYVQGKNLFGLARNLIGIDSANRIVVGETTATLIINTSSNVNPSANNTKNLGSSSVKWKTVYTTNISDGTNTATISDLISGSRPIYEHTICDNNLSGQPVLVIYTHDSTPITTPAQLRAIYDPNNTGLVRKLPMISSCFIGFGSMAIYASMSFDGSQNDNNLISYGVFDVGNQTVTTVYLTNIGDIVRTV